MMKTRILLAVLGVTLAVPFPAVAAQDNRELGSGRYEWRQVPQVGPRAVGPPLKRVWVPTQAAMADCDCNMMRMSAADCMKPMQHMGARSAG